MTDSSTLAVDIEKAIHVLKGKQQAYCIQWVQDALEMEQQRKQKLSKCTTKEECQRLEKHYEKERIQDKIRLQQIQEDHQMIIRAKIAQWKVHGVPTNELGVVVDAGTNTPLKRMETTSTTAEKPKKKAVSKATLERLSAVKRGTSVPGEAITIEQDQKHNK